MCEHLNFEAKVVVSRLSHDPGAPIDGYSAHITIKCHDCELPFSFLGDYPSGMHYAKPMVSSDSTELRAPIGPGAQPLASMSVYTVPGKVKS